MICNLVILLSNFEPVHFSMSGSNCCFFTCIQISKEESKVVWCSHLFKDFPQFVVIHAVKGFSIVSEAAAAAAKLHQSCLTVRPFGLQPARLLCPWDSLGKNTRVGCHALLQGIFWPRDWTQASCIAGRFFIAEPQWKPPVKQK